MSTTTVPTSNGNVHHCDAWPTAEEKSGIYPNPCRIERSHDGSWYIDAGTGEYGWSIFFCPFCGIALGLECALCMYRHRMPDRAAGCDCACHAESPTEAELRSVDSAEVAEQSSANEWKGPSPCSSFRIMVDELRTWPHAKRPFLEGSCHLMVEIIGDGTEEQALEALNAFAEKIGMRRAWFQSKPYGCSHYDLTPGRRVRAIAAGAVFVPALEQARRRRRLSGAKSTAEVEAAARLASAEKVIESVRLALPWMESEGPISAGRLATIVEAIAAHDRGVKPEALSGARSTAGDERRRKGGSP